MDQETADYIRSYYSHLFTALERKALSHAIFSSKLEAYGREKWEQRYLERGLVSTDPAVLNLLSNGYPSFVLVAAERALATYGDRIYLNRCRKCDRLARTPRAKQCRHCGYDWHDLTAAKLEFMDVFNITGIGPVVVTKISGGESISAGQFADFTTLGINKHLRIGGVWITTRLRNDMAEGLLNLSMPGLNAEDVAWLKKSKPKGREFEVLKEGWLS